MFKKKVISIKFQPDATSVLKEMAKEEGVPVNELVERAINFYQVHMDAKKNHKQVCLQRPDGVIEHVVMHTTVQFQPKMCAASMGTEERPTP